MRDEVLLWSQAGDSVFRAILSESTELELFPFGVCGLDTLLLLLELFEEFVVDCFPISLEMLLLVRKLPSVVLEDGDTVVYKSGGKSRIL